MALDMSRRRNPSPSRPPPRAYRRAFERLDDALDPGTETDYSDRIEMLGRLMFGDDWRRPESAPQSDNPQQNL